MKLAAVVTLALLLNSSLPQVGGVMGPGADAGASHPAPGALELRLLPRIIFEGEIVGAEVRCPALRDGMVAIALYRPDGQGLLREAAGSIQVRDGAGAIESFCILKAPGRRYLAAIVDSYGAAELFPTRLTLPLLSTLSGGLRSGLLELFVLPKSYATISQEREHVLGAADNTYLLEYWAVAPDAPRDPAWEGLEPSRLLGSLYEPSEGVVYLYTTNTCGGIDFMDWEQTSRSGAHLKLRWEGREEVTIWALAQPLRPGIDVGWVSSVTTRFYPSEFWSLEAPRVAQAGPVIPPRPESRGVPAKLVTVALRKSALCLSQTDFDNDMRRLGSLDEVLKRRADRLLPATGAATVRAFLRNGPYALEMVSQSCELRGAGEVSLELPLGGRYYIAASCDRSQSTPSGAIYWSDWSGLFDLVSETSVAGPWVGVEPLRTVYAPGEEAFVRVSTGPAGGLPALIRLDGALVATVSGSGPVSMGALAPGPHTITAVVDAPGAERALNSFEGREREPLDWFAQASIYVGSFTAALSVPEELVSGLEAGARVVVVDPYLRPVPGARVELRASSPGYREGLRALLGEGVTDEGGSFSCTFTAPALPDWCRWVSVAAVAACGAERVEVERVVRIRAERLTALISTDKPMYKGGDVIHARFIVWSEDRLVPVRGGAEWSLVSPRGHVIYREGVELGELGTADMNVSVGGEASWGYHWLTLSIGGREVARRALLLKPYTLPMTRLELLTPSQVAQTGEEVVVRARVQYTLWGAPVGGGAIDYTVSALAGIDSDRAAYGERGQGQAQGQGQGSGQASGQPPPQEGAGETALTNAELEEAYLSSLTELFKWTGRVELVGGEALLCLTVPPLAAAMRLSAVFTDELDHMNEGSLVIYIGEKPALLSDGLTISTPGEAFSVLEPVLVSFHTAAPSRELTARVMVAGEDSPPVEVLSASLVTGPDGWLNTSLQELGVSVRALLERGLHSYVIDAFYPSDERVRASAALSVFRSRYTASSERLIYRAGQTARVTLFAEDGLEPGGAAAGEDFIARVRSSGGTLAQLSGRTAGGRAELAIPVPQDAASDVWTVEVDFGSASVSLQLGVLSREDSLMEASVAGLPTAANVDILIPGAMSRLVYIDAWSPSSTRHITAAVESGHGRALVPRASPDEPMVLSVYSFGPGGLSRRLFRLEPERTPPALSVSTDRRDYEPGELVNITITTDRPAEVSLAVVSNALYDLNPVYERTWLEREMRRYVPDLPLVSQVREIFSRDGLIAFAEGFHPSRSTCPRPNYGQGQGYGGGSIQADGSGANGAGQGQGQGQGAQEAQSGSELLPRDMDMSDEMRADMEGVRMRRWFTDAAYWNPSVLVGGGSVTLTVRLPDNVRTWRATAVAVTAQCTGTVASHKFNVKKTFYAEMRVPQTMTQDDEVLLRALVYNFRQEALRVRVGLYASDWLKVIGENEKWLDMEPDSVRSVDFYVKVIEAGKRNLTLMATDFGRSRDAVLAVVDVRANGVERVTRLSGEILDGTSFYVSRDRWSVEGAVRATLSVALSFEGLVLEGMESLCDYPYGCNEQTMTRLVPDVLVRRYLENLGRLTPELEESLRDMILVGIQKLLDTQHDDGGWGWYKQDATNTFMTAWILFGLSTMERNGFFIDRGVLEAGARCLVERMNKDGSWTGAHWMGGRDVAMSAFATYALALSGCSDEEALSRAVWRLQCHLSSGGAVDAYEVALMAMALREAGAPAEELEGWLAGHIRGDHWDGAALGGAAETTGWAVLALLRSGELDAALMGLRWIVRNRSAYGWGSTSATMAVLLALDEVSRRSFYTSGGSGRVDLMLDGELLRSWENETGACELDLAPLLTPAPRLVSFATSGGARGYYSYVQIETVRPPVRVSYPGSVRAVEGEAFRVVVRVRVEGGEEHGVRLASLGASFPSALGVELLQKSVDLERGEVAFDLWPRSAGEKILNPLIVSYQLDGGGDLSSLIRQYHGPIRVSVEAREAPLSSEAGGVTVVKTLSAGSLLPGETVTVTLLVRAEGGALGREVELRDLIPPQLCEPAGSGSSWQSGAGDRTPGSAEERTRERSWRLELDEKTYLSYDLVLREDFSGELGRAVVLVDGRIVTASNAVELSSERAGAFVSRRYEVAEGLVGEPVTVRLSCGGTDEGLYYVALEDTLPPGFEVDRSSLESNLDESVKACEVSGSRVSFLLDCLRGKTEMTYRAIPTLAGSLVAPPARLFSMYNESMELFSASAELIIRPEGNGVEEDAQEEPGPSTGEATRGAGAGGAPAQPVADVESARTRRAIPSPDGEGQREELPSAVRTDISVVDVRPVGELRKGQEAGLLCELRVDGLEENTWIELRIYIDGALVRSLSHVLLAGARRCFIDYYAVFRAGTHHLRVVADPSDTVPESDEGNNELSIRFYVAGDGADPRTQPPGPAGPELPALATLVLAAVLAGAGVRSRAAAGPARRRGAEKRSSHQPPMRSQPPR
ncbi:MAG: alpha-2-macroglobulin family protein [Thermoplasmatota archaeon]